MRYFPCFSFAAILRKLFRMFFYFPDNGTDCSFFQYPIVRAESENIMQIISPLSFCRILIGVLRPLRKTYACYNDINRIHRRSSMKNILRSLAVLCLVLLFGCTSKPDDQPASPYEIGGKTYYNTVDQYGNAEHAKVWFG